MAGDDMNEAIMLHVRKNHGLLIGERRALGVVDDARVLRAGARRDVDDLEARALLDAPGHEGLSGALEALDAAAEPHRVLRGPVAVGRVAQEVGRQGLARANHPNELHSPVRLIVLGSRA